MEPSVITFIMNGKTYRLSSNDNDAIRQIPKQDREQLIALLESVKLQDRLAASVVQQAVGKAGIVSPVALPLATNTVAKTTEVKPERIGKGDVDDIIARLIMEERRHKKPSISQQTIYKWAAGFIAAIFLLVLVF